MNVGASSFFIWCVMKVNIFIGVPRDWFTMIDIEPTHFCLPVTSVESYIIQCYFACISISISVKSNIYASVVVFIGCWASWLIGQFVYDLIAVDWASIFWSIYRGPEFDITPRRFKYCLKFCIRSLRMKKRRRRQNKFCAAVTHDFGPPYYFQNLQYAGQHVKVSIELLNLPIFSLLFT